MGRANVYLPDDLERRVKAAQIPISEVCQRALLSAVEAAEGDLHPFTEAEHAAYHRGSAAGMQWTRSASAESLLTLLRDQRLDDIPATALPADWYSLTQQQTLAWEAGFLEAARAAGRAAISASTPTPSATPDDSDDTAPEPDTPTTDSESEPPVVELPATTPAPELGDDAGCHIGATLDGEQVSFDPHAAVRASKSPLFAILGDADLRARLTLSLAQDAAARGTGVLLVDISGRLSARAAGLGKNVRLVRPAPPVLPRLEDLTRGAIGLGGLWDTLSDLSRGSGLTGLLGGAEQTIIEPGYVTVLSLTGDGALANALSIAHAAHTLSGLVSPVDFPRLLQVDLPSGMTIPAALGTRLGQIIRTARERNAAIGISADSAETVNRIGGHGAMLSTVFAFATSDPLEADQLRNLLGANAPILLNPPGMTNNPTDQIWVVMRDLNGHLGQVRIDGS